MTESWAVDAMYLEGMLSISAAMDANSRPIYALMVLEKTREYPILKLIKRAQAAGIPVEQVSESDIDALANGNTHGGVIARVGERHYVALDALAAGDPAPLVVMLDGVEDPFNFGQSIRAFYAAGAAGLIVRPRTWHTAAGVVARASAGASELMPTALAETVEAAAEHFRGRGLRIAVADKTRAVSIYDADLRGGLLLVIGGERRGVTRSFADSADLRLAIPYGRAWDQSLGTTAASAILAFEIMRQRKG